MPDTDDPTQPRSLAAYLEMARLQNVLPSFLLVFVGAFCAAHHWSVLLMPAVWAMAVCSAGIAVSSVIVNDYFDFRTGVDLLNSPHKPLPQGTVTPDGAVLLAASIYIGVLVIACTFNMAVLRWTIAAAATATLLYTPVLKGTPGMKNLTVAFIIAASPFCGALATGSSAAVLSAIAPLTAFLFALINYREILMDINDRAGDAASSVPTLPVSLGPVPALIVATGSLFFATVVGFLAVHTAAPTWVPLAAAGAASPALHALLVATFLLGMLPAWLDVCNVYLSGLDADVVSAAIGNSFKSIAVGLVLLTLLR